MFRRSAECASFSIGGDEVESVLVTDALVVPAYPVDGSPNAGDLLDGLENGVIDHTLVIEECPYDSGVVGLSGEEAGGGIECKVEDRTVADLRCVGAGFFRAGCCRDHCVEAFAIRDRLGAAVVES
jgi:hypothetical protein